MDGQGLSQGSLRNSHRETHAIQRKPAPAALQALVSKCLENCSDDLVLRQRLDPQKTEGALKRGAFFVLENEGRADPGFLVFLPGKPVVYAQFRKGRDGARRLQASTLRMRVSSSVSEGGGSVLIATLDDVGHTLRLEDVWMWRGERLYAKDTFTKRRERLKEFVERHWVPDARLLGGIFTTMAIYKTLEQFSERTEWSETHSVEVVPEQAGRRRMVLYLEERLKSAEGPAGLKQQRESGPVTTVVSDTTPAVPVSVAVPHTPCPQRRARAVPVDKMPDVYDLYGEDGLPISRASVQQFALSQQLRTKKEAWVTARWRAEFGGYEIAAIVD